MILCVDAVMRLSHRSSINVYIYNGEAHYRHFFENLLENRYSIRLFYVRINSTHMAKYETQFYKA